MVSGLAKAELLIPALLCIGLLTEVSVAAKLPTVPVLVGQDPESDACAGSGIVVGLDPTGDNFLSVRVGPGSKFREIDRLNTSDSVYVCDERLGWYGIVYPVSRACNVSSVSFDKPQPYSGPCRSGWVYKKFIKLTAG